MAVFSAACERNKAPILDQLRLWLRGDEHVLEIGSGSGQHAAYFSAHLPTIRWQCSEQASALADLQQNLPSSLAPARAIDVLTYNWSEQRYDAVYTANTLHIIPWPAVCYFLTQVKLALASDGLLIVYGPMRYQHAFTSPSNASFDTGLKKHNPAQGIRDFEACDVILREHGFSLSADVAMPAHNQLLVWRL